MRCTMAIELHWEARVLCDQSLPSVYKSWLLWHLYLMKSGDTAWTAAFSHSTTTEFCDSCSMHLSPCLVSSGTATTNQPRPDKEVSCVFQKQWSSWPAVSTHALWLFSFPVFLAYLHLFGGPYFHHFSELLSSFASKMDPKRQLKIKTGVLKRYVSFAENFSQMRRMYNNNTLPFFGCTNYNLRVMLRIVIK